MSGKQPVAMALFLGDYVLRILHDNQIGNEDVPLDSVESSSNNEYKCELLRCNSPVIYQSNVSG